MALDTIQNRVSQLEKVQTIDSKNVDEINTTLAQIETELNGLKSEQEKQQSLLLYKTALNNLSSKIKDISNPKLKDFYGRINKSQGQIDTLISYGKNLDQAQKDFEQANKPGFFQIIGRRVANEFLRPMNIDGHRPDWENLQNNNVNTNFGMGVLDGIFEIPDAIQKLLANPAYRKQVRDGINFLFKDGAIQGVINFVMSPLNGLADGVKQGNAYQIGKELANSLMTYLPMFRAASGAGTLARGAGASAAARGEALAKAALAAKNDGIGALKNGGAGILTATGKGLDSFGKTLQAPQNAINGAKNAVKNIVGNRVINRGKPPVLAPDPAVAAAQTSKNTFQEAYNTTRKTFSNDTFRLADNVVTKEILGRLGKAKLDVPLAQRLQKLDEFLATPEGQRIFNELDNPSITIRNKAIKDFDEKIGLDLVMDRTKFRDFKNTGSEFKFFGTKNFRDTVRTDAKKMLADMQQQAYKDDINATKSIIEQTAKAQDELVTGKNALDTLKAQENAAQLEHITKFFGEKIDKLMGNPKTNFFTLSLKDGTVLKLKVIDRTRGVLEVVEAKNYIPGNKGFNIGDKWKFEVFPNDPLQPQKLTFSGVTNSKNILGEIEKFGTDSGTRVVRPLDTTILTEARTSFGSAQLQRWIKTQPGFSAGSTSAANAEILASRQAFNTALLKYEGTLSSQIGNLKNIFNSVPNGTKFKIPNGNGGFFEVQKIARTLKNKSNFKLGNDIGDLKFEKLYQTISGKNGNINIPTGKIKVTLPGNKTAILDESSMIMRMSGPGESVFNNLTENLVSKIPNGLKNTYNKYGTATKGTLYGLLMINNVANAGEQQWYKNIVSNQSALLKSQLDFNNFISNSSLVSGQNSTDSSTGSSQNSDTSVADSADSGKTTGAQNPGSSASGAASSPSATPDTDSTSDSDSSDNGTDTDSGAETSGDTIFDFDAKDFGKKENLNETQKNQLLQLIGVDISSAKNFLTNAKNSDVRLIPENINSAEYSFEKYMFYMNQRFLSSKEKFIDIKNDGLEKKLFLQPGGGVHLDLSTISYLKQDGKTYYFAKVSDSSKMRGNYIVLGVQDGQNFVPALDFGKKQVSTPNTQTQTPSQATDSQPQKPASQPSQPEKQTSLEFSDILPSDKDKIEKNFGSGKKDIKIKYESGIFTSDGKPFATDESLGDFEKGPTSFDSQSNQILLNQFASISVDLSSLKQKKNGTSIQYFSQIQGTGTPLDGKYILVGEKKSDGTYEKNFD